VVAARKSARMIKATRVTGMETSTQNTFVVLNSVDDNILQLIAKDGDIKLGEGTEEILENICAIKLEEQTRAMLAEAQYKQRHEKMLTEKHAIEGENLTLACVENNQRGLEKKLDENHVTEGGGDSTLECAENNQGGLEGGQSR
jgi:hypothetical protein